MIIAPWDILQCVKIKWRYGHKSTIEAATALKCIGYVGLNTLRQWASICLNLNCLNCWPQYTCNTKW